MRKILITILAVISAICVGLLVTACGGEEEVYSTLEMEEGILYLTDFSVMYTSEEESPYGEVDESALAEEKSGTVQSYYLVMQFDMQTASDISGMEYLTVELTVLDADIVDTTIDYTNTSSTTEITSDGQTTITATYSLPDKAKLIKNVQLVVKLKPKTKGITDITYNFSSDYKSVTGYGEEDTTFNLSSSMVTVSKTSLKYTVYTLSDGDICAVSGIGTKSGSFCIPETHNGMSVTVIGEEAFYDCDSITKIIIPDSVTSIGDYAFEFCGSIENIIIPDSVTSIGDYAFAYCDSLISATIGSGVTSMGECAFNSCKDLTEINFNATAMDNLSEDNGVFNCAGQSGNGIIVTIGANVKKIPANLFYPCNYANNPFFSSNSYIPKITSVVFENGSVCKNIGSSAFYNCTALVNISIPDSVTFIGDYTFYNCTSLANVTFKNTSGWWVSTSSLAIVATVDVTDTSQNAAYLTDTYYSYYWHRSDS